MAQTTKAPKAPNYSEEAEQKLLKEYGANPSPETVKALAAALGKTSASIVQKLVRMGIYVKPTYARKDGTKVEKKDQTADAIGRILKLTEGDTGSLSNCNRRVLQAIFQALANSVPMAQYTELKADMDKLENHVFALDEFLAETEQVRDFRAYCENRGDQQRLG